MNNPISSAKETEIKYNLEKGLKLKVFPAWVFS